MTPFDFWLSAFRAPLSGDVPITQSFDPRVLSPNVTLEFAGDREVEAKIVGRVASYGRQLDTVIEAVLLLAKNQDLELDRLSSLSDEIEAEKNAHTTHLRGQAAKALKALRDLDPDGFASLLKEFKAEGSSHATPEAG